jgi:PAS domain S-box-containing protein
MKKSYLYILLIFITTSLYSNKLSVDERHYLVDNKTITMCINQNWAPIEFKNRQNKYSGIVPDILKILQKDLNVKFEEIKTNSWEQSQQFLKEKKCDILPAAIKTKSREKYALFTDSYLHYKLAIITQNDKPLIDNIENILDKSISRKKGSGLITQLKKRYPNIKIVQTKDYLEAIHKVSSGEVYCTIATLPVASYYIHEFAINNLNVAGYTNMTYDLSIAIRDDKPILHSILNKALKNISTNQIKSIHNKWEHSEKKDSLNYTVVLNLSIIILVVIIFLIYKQFILKNSIKDYHELLDSTIEALILIKDGVVIEANKSALKIFKLDSIDELIGSNIFEHIPAESIELVKKMTMTEYEEPYEIDLYDKEGKKFNALVKGCKLKNRNLRLTSIIDITKSKEQEKQLMEKSKLASMGEMIGNIAHQWRQPLNVISATTSSVKIQKELKILDDEFFYKSCNMITKNVMFLSNTIDDFTNYIKDNRVKKEFSTKTMINSFLTLCDSIIIKNNINIILDTPEDYHIQGYKNELMQCILNIFNNAVDAFNLHNIEKRYLFISIKKEEDNLVIIIKDNANGIPNNIIDKIFEPYFTTKNQSQGTGLGLNMTHQLIVEGMNGKISVKNEDYPYYDEIYKGVSFKIILPI